MYLDTDTDTEMYLDTRYFFPQFGFVICALYEMKRYDVEHTRNKNTTTTPATTSNSETRDG